jgi:hypothetical protein
MSVLFNRAPDTGRILATIDGPGNRWVIVVREFDGTFLSAILGSSDNVISEVHDPVVALEWLSIQPTT